MQELKELREQLTTGKYQGKIYVVIKTTLSPICSNTRLVNPTIDSGARAAIITNSRKTQCATISFEDIKSIKTHTYYDGAEDYYIEYNSGMVVSATFSGDYFNATA